MSKRPKDRSPHQTATAVSMSKKLFAAMEKGRKILGEDRSNFVRLCISKELLARGFKEEDLYDSEETDPAKMNGSSVKPE